MGKEPLENLAKDNQLFSLNIMVFGIQWTLLEIKFT